MRSRLANRREHWLVDFEHDGHRYTAGIGRFPGGQLAEVFLTTVKDGTALSVAARDAAVAASLCLQHGCTPATLRKALTRNGDGSAGGALARLLDILAAEETIGSGLPEPPPRRATDSRTLAFAQPLNVPKGT